MSLVVCIIVLVHLYDYSYVRITVTIVVYNNDTAPLSYIPTHIYS